MNVAVGLMDGLGLDGDLCIRVIPQHLPRGVSAQGGVCLGGVCLGVGVSA